MKTIREGSAAAKNKDEAGTDDASPQDKTEKKYPSKLHENRIDPKQLSRVNKFEGGSGYKEWALDIEITVESMCPGFRAMLNLYMSNPSTRGERAIYADLAGSLEHAETRGKEFFQLIFILTGGEAKTAIKSCEDGLLAWATLWKTYNRPTLAKTLRMYKEATIPRVATHPGGSSHA